MCEVRLSAAGNAIGLVVLASLQACAHGVEVPPDNEQRATPALDAGELDADETPEEEDDADSAERADADGEVPTEAGAASDAGRSFDATSGSAQSLDSGGDAGALAADASVASDASDAAAPYSCPSCMLKVQWNTSTTTASTQTIAGYLKLTNLGSSAIPLSAVTVRYWLREPQAESMIVECYHWDDGKGANKCTRPSGASGNTYTNLSVRVGSAASDLRFIELGFPLAAGELTPGGSAPGALQLAFHLPSYAALTQSDDPSFDAALSAASTSMLFDAPKISAYLGGMLAWGNEP
jgi:Cellulose binding domain